MLAQKEMFDMMTAKGISPNQYYLLLCIHDSIKSKEINVSQELRQLVDKDYVIISRTSKGDVVLLTDKAKKLIKSVEQLFTTLAKNAAVKSMGDDYEERIKEYNDLFPKGLLPTGSYGRTNVKNLKSAFKWFFDNFDYSWDVILEATEKYLEDRENNNWEFTSTSQYFIRKQEPDKSYISKLANCCEAILTGEETPQVQPYRINVD